MKYTQEELKQEIDSAIDNKDEVVIIAYSLIDKTEELIQHILKKALSEKGKMDFYTPILSCIKELTTNGNKANIKSILISDKIIKDPTNRMEIIKGIKSILNEEALLKYGIVCKEKNLSVRIYMKCTESSLRIKVINPLPVSEEELERIHGKMEKSKKYDNLAEFYMENPDPMAEGMGLGLSMIMVLLKGLAINQDCFTLTTDFESKTVAMLDIPL